MTLSVKEVKGLIWREEVEEESKGAEVGKPVSLMATQPWRESSRR